MYAISFLKSENVDIKTILDLFIIFHLKLQHYTTVQQLNSCLY